MRPIRVRTFYPSDPTGIVPGGVDTFMRGILKYAPDDLQFSVVGMTTDPMARPLGEWTTCRLGKQEFAFFPAVQVYNAGARTRIPLSLRYTAAVTLRLHALRQGFDIFEFHRIEPALLFLADARPKNAFFHQDMAVIKSDKADIVWRHMPGIYFSIEKKVVSSLSAAWCVRQEGVTAMQGRHPARAHTIRFIPTWVDTAVFSPPDEAARSRSRSAFAEQLGVDSDATWIVTVGRLDTQKDPALMLAAVSRLRAQAVNVKWLVVGDGVLRPSLQKSAEEAGIASHVLFLGLKSPEQIAALLQACDVFAMSSAYEGMPMAMLEALGSGLPVATTDVGEVRQVVRPNVNGAISVDRSEEAFASCVADVIRNRQSYRGAPALKAIERFQPSAVLAPVYDKYRQLGMHPRTKRTERDRP